jgi:catechol 2,3-dioxygenase-like lactoylglutathione lyase family enzyme
MTIHLSNEHAPSARRAAGVSRRTVIALLLLIAAFLSRTAASAVTRVLSDGPVVFGHYHLYVPDVEAQKKFWVEHLGGQPSRFVNAPIEIARFPSIIVLIQKRDAPAPSSPQALGHMALQVANLRATVDRLQAAGYLAVTNSIAGVDNVSNGIGVSIDQRRQVAFVRAPDNVLVELVENRRASTPALDHVHLTGANGREMQTWYVTRFGAKAGRIGAAPTADFPGGRLIFSEAARPAVASKGQLVDHLGFEVRNLERVCKNLQSMGATVTREYALVPKAGAAGLDIGVCLVTDPFGVSLELLEGEDQ